MKIPDQIMEPEAVALLTAITKDSDPEIVHGQAEGILLALLRANGLGQAATAFEEARDRVGFWYA